jgi:hypothetical protein
MLLTGSSTDSLSAGTLVLITCFSAVCLVNGVRHYHGRGTWLLRWLPSEASFFAPAWYGAMGLMVVLCELAGRVGRVLEALLAIPTLVLFAIALMSLVWLPSRLLPEWYRDRRQRRSVTPVTR